VAVTKEITRLEKSNVKLSLTVPQDEIRSQYQDLLRDYTKNAQIPGFRKGKVPREVLERKFGEALKGEALGRIIESAIAEVFKDENLPRNERPLPYAGPQLQDEPKLDFDRDLTFSVVYDVLPEVKVGQWKGLEIEVPDAKVTDEDLDRELADVRERNAIVLDRDDGAAAQKGDVVTVNYRELGENGEVLPHTERQDFVFTLGTGYNIYDFDDEITGMQKDETREFTKTFPGDFKEADLAGQTKKIQVTLTALKEKKLPDLDDDLAQDVDEKFNTLEDLKNDIRKRLEKNLEQRLRELRINSILEKIMENTPVILPESMIRVEMEGRLRNLARQFNVSTEQALQMLARIEKAETNPDIDGLSGISDPGPSPEYLEKEWRPGAEKALHSRLIVETLMEEQGFAVSDEELEKEMETMAAESRTDLEEFKKYYQQDNMKEYLMEDIKERKLFDTLLAENTLKPGKKETYMDLMAKSR
jgi:trigger factor